MRLSRADLLYEAAATGFQPEPLEKVVRLLELLEGLRSHPFLKSRIVLKGGTALNLFVFDLPRLSVDLDLNYVGARERGEMLTERPKIEQAIQAVCGRLDIRVQRVAPDHAGGKWRLSYSSATGRSGRLELDVNFLLRVPLWPSVLADSKRVGSFAAHQVPLLDVHELAAGKLAALFGRSASRDLFDVHELLRKVTLDPAKLRLGFVVYGGISRRDWRSVAVEDVQTNSRTVDRELAPLLRSDLAPIRDRLVKWTESMVADCRSLLSIVLPLADNEREFLELLNTRGEIVPELLTGDDHLQARISAQPGLQWKALNVRRHLGLETRS